MITSPAFCHLFLEFKDLFCSNFDYTNNNCVRDFPHYPISQFLILAHNLIRMHDSFIQKGCGDDALSVVKKTVYRLSTQ